MPGVSLKPSWWWLHRLVLQTEVAADKWLSEPVVCVKFFVLRGFLRKLGLLAFRRL